MTVFRAPQTTTGKLTHFGFGFGFGSVKPKFWYFRFRFKSRFWSITSFFHLFPIIYSGSSPWIKNYRNKRTALFLQSRSPLEDMLKQFLNVTSSSQIIFEPDGLIVMTFEKKILIISFWKFISLSWVITKQLPLYFHDLGSAKYFFFSKCLKYTKHFH